MDLHIPVSPVLGGPDEHVAEAGGEVRAAVGVRVLGHGGIELRGVVDAEIDPGAFDGRAGGGDHPETDLRGLRVVLDQVDFRIARGAEDDFLRTVVLAEHLGVGEHRAGGGGVEPAQVQDGLRLTGPEEHPFPVGPGLHPGVVAFLMGPARGIDLPGRDAHAAQGGHAEGRFLAAAAQGVLDGRQGRVRPAVGRLVGHLLVAPVVHFQDGLLHGHSLHPRLQLVIEHESRGIQVLVVRAQRQHEVAELPLGDLPAHLLAGLEGFPHIGQKEFRRIVGDIGLGHIGIEELEGLALLLRRRKAVRRETPARRLHPRLVVLVDRVAITLFRQEMGAAARGKQKRHRGQNAAKRLLHRAVRFSVPQMYAISDK